MSLSAIGAELEGRARGGTIRPSPPSQSNKVRKGARSLRVSKEFIIVKEYGLKVRVANILVGLCAWNTKKKKPQNLSNKSKYMQKDQNYKAKIRYNVSQTMFDGKCANQCCYRYIVYINMQRLQSNT